MPNYTSCNWTPQGGCTKHSIPETPCPQCLAIADPDVQVTLTNGDKVALDEPDTQLRDLFPDGEAGDALCGRVEL